MNKFTEVIEHYRGLQQLTPQAWMGGKSDQVMLIDMGHGGMDTKGNYVTAPNKMAKHENYTFYEGAWTRAVGWALASLLGEAQRNYIVLTPGFVDIPLTARVHSIEQLKRHLSQRDKKPYVHSIHGNAYGLESVNGVEVFTSPGNTKADPLATVYYEQLEKLGWRMRPGYGDGDPDKEARFAMLTGPESHGIPSLLTETGFYTNEAQADEMCDIKTITQIAELMLQADIQIDYNDLLL